MEKYSIQSFKECFLFSACFFFLSNNTLHLMFCTYIFYWNTNKNYCHKTIPCVSDFKRYLFILYHIISSSIFVLSQLCFICWSSPFPLLFNWLRVQLSKISQSKIHFEIIYYPLLNIFWIYWMFIYAFILAVIRKEFKLSYKLKLRVT